MPPAAATWLPESSGIPFPQERLPSLGENIAFPSFTGCRAQRLRGMVVEDMETVKLAVSQGATFRQIRGKRLLVVAGKM
jgi:hypothetical protein